MLILAILPSLVVALEIQSLLKSLKLILMVGTVSGKSAREHSCEEQDCVQITK